MIFEQDNSEDTYERNSRVANERRTRFTSNGVAGKLPPQAIDLEECILGALMLEKDAFFEVNDFMHAEIFYETRHQKIYSRITDLFQKSSPIDIMTVTASLRASGELEMIGGAYYITELTNRVASAANIIYHARIVYQKYLQRELIKICMEVSSDAYEDTTDVFNLLEKNQLALMKMMNFNNSQQSIGIKDMMNAALVELEKPVVSGLTGVGTGFTCVNDYTAGWQKGELTILAARPAMGKTALAVQLAQDAAILFNVPTVIFSLEMTQAQLSKRMISNQTEIFLDKINKRSLVDFDKQQLAGRLYALKESPLHIDDTPALTTVSFRAKCIRLKKLYDIQLIVVDYLQLMVGVNAQGKNKGNREQEIGEITRCLKGIAKELDVPVIALSQLSRSVESRPGTAKRPQLSDLRESGNIEQDADNVLFLFRPEYYGISVDQDNNSTESMAELIWAKHRMGETGTLYLKFRGAVQRFENWVAGPTDFNKEQYLTPTQLAQINPQKSFEQAKIGFSSLTPDEGDDAPF